MRSLLTTGFILLLIRLGRGQTQHVEEDIMDVAVVESPDSLSGACLDMPRDLTMGIEFAQNKPVNLKLKLNKNKNEQRSVLIPTTLKSGKQRLVKQNISIKRNKGFYQDVTNGAAVEVTCIRTEDGCCDPAMIGTFSVEGKEYEIQPLPEQQVPRVKRGAFRGWKNKFKRFRKRLYGIYKHRKFNPSASDCKSKANNINTSHQTPTRTASMTKAETIINGGRNTQTNRFGQSFQRTAATGARGSQTGLPHYRVGLLLIIDYSVYKRYYDNTEGKSPSLQERDMLAKEAIREHAAYLVNGIDLRYKNLKTFRVDVVAVGYVINDKDSENKWTDQRMRSASVDFVDADTILRQLTQWRRDIIRDPSVPKHDHVMLLTGYNLTIDLWESTRDPGVAGYAYVGSMCAPTSVSVIEDFGGLDNILTGAHELGHSFNAPHDSGVNDGCRAADNFIMTPTGSTDGSEKHNLFHFSDCSENIMRSYIENLGERQCLLDEALVYNAEEFNEHTSIQAGQRYHPNQQCSQMLGYHSYYAWGGQLGDGPESICTGMACKNNQGPESFNIFFAYRGTPCGNQMWCINGLCTESHNAPLRDGDCPHGDTKTLFGENRNMPCDEYISLNPRLCYSKLHFAFCCQSCKRIMRRERVDCEFGDRLPGCVKEKHCGINSNLRSCCGTCSDTPFPVLIDLRTARPPVSPTSGWIPKPTTPRPPPRIITTTRGTTSTKRNPPTEAPRPQIPVRPVDIPPVDQPPVHRPLPPRPPITNNRQLCVESSASFFRISCGWIARTLISSNMCDWGVFRSRCCKPCPSFEPALPMAAVTTAVTTTTTTTAPPCVDKADCRMSTGASCYTGIILEQCCATCQIFRTNVPDCEFGDKNNRCARLFHMDPIFTCTGRVKHICCGSCRNFSVHGRLAAASFTTSTSTTSQPAEDNPNNSPQGRRRNWRLQQRLWPRNRQNRRLRGQIQDPGTEVNSRNPSANAAPVRIEPVTIVRKKIRKAYRRLKERYRSRRKHKKPHNKRNRYGNGGKRKRH